MSADTITADRTRSDIIRNRWGTRHPLFWQAWQLEDQEAADTAAIASLPYQPQRLEVVGVASAFWASDTGTDRVRVIMDADRLGTPAREGWLENPFDSAGYLSSGNDTGASSYSPDTGGGTMVRDADTGEVIAKYRDGEDVPLSDTHQPFDYAQAEVLNG